MIFIALIIIRYYFQIVKFNSSFQPFLQYMYHQIYHVSNHSNECLSGKSVSRCILLKETNELRHLRNIQKALDEIQYSEQEHDIEKSSNAKTYQTIKCNVYRFVFLLFVETIINKMYWHFNWHFQV